MINHIPNKKALVLNSKNIQKHIHTQVAKRDYTQIFTSSKIVLSKKFKKNILNNSEFADHPFYSCYTEIEKFHKRIPCDVPPLGVSITLTKYA